jgi:hypothetical protein
MITTIPNVYTALQSCVTANNLRESLRQAFASMGWADPIPDYFIPGTAIASSSQMALALTISTPARVQLMRPEDVASFDRMLGDAVNKWAELHKQNRVSKILTDYLR